MRLLVALVVLAVWSTAAQAATGNRDAIAVIIGNKTYGGETPAVDFAHNDAEAMKRFAIDVLGYREGNIIDLRDASKAVLEDTFGTRESHEGKLNDYVREGRSDVVVFYSGHGVPNLDDQKGYLLPVDGNPNRIQLSGYPVDLLLENLSKIDARSMTVYLDACFSGDSPKGMIVQATSGVSVTPRLPVDRGGVVLITAAEGKQYASWDEEAGHGLFTHHLLLGLGGLADGEDFGNGDGEVTVSEVKAYLDEEMTYQARRRYGRRQNVTVFGDPSIVLAAVSGDRVTEILSESQASTSETNTEVDQALWDAATELGTAKAYEHYLVQFPNGVFAANARIRLESIMNLESSSPANVNRSSQTDVARRFNIMPVIINDQRHMWAEEILERQFRSLPLSDVVREPSSVMADDIVVAVAVTRINVSPDSEHNAGAELVGNLLSGILDQVTEDFAFPLYKIADISVVVQAVDKESGRTLAENGMSYARHSDKFSDGEIAKIALEEAIQLGGERLIARLLGAVPDELPSKEQIEMSWRAQNNASANRRAGGRQ